MVSAAGTNIFPQESCSGFGAKMKALKCANVMNKSITIEIIKGVRFDFFLFIHFSGGEKENNNFSLLKDI